MKNKLELLKQYTDIQACDESIWFIPESIAEQLLLQELRLLVWLIEDATDDEIRAEIKKRQRTAHKGV